MTAFNFFSHGTQDLYPTFLQKQHHFDTHTDRHRCGDLNLGAIVGGISFGIWSEKIGRKRAIVIASLLALADHSLWAFAQRRFCSALGGFMMQVAVQGAWGIVPVHLNELSPPLARSLSRLCLSARQPDRVQECADPGGHRRSHGNNYALAMAFVCAIIAITIAFWTAISPRAE